MIIIMFTVNEIPVFRLFDLTYWECNMKAIFIFMLLFITTINFAQTNEKKDRTLMVQILLKNSLKISNDIVKSIKTSAEAVLTDYKYLIIDEQVQIQALKEQSEQRKKECYDESCLVDTGKMLAASKLVIIEIFAENKKYKFVTSVIDIETGSKIATNLNWFKDDINDGELLDNAVKEYMLNLINKTTKTVTDDVLSESKANNINPVIVEKLDKNKNANGKYVVTIKSNPENADVFDLTENKFLGKTPLVIETEEGDLSLSVEGTENYEKQKYLLNIEENININFNLTSLLKKVKFNINEANSKIYINGDYITTTKLNEDCIIDIKKGINTLTIEKEDFESVVSEINLQEDTTIKYDLIPKVYYLTIKSPQNNVKIHLNNEYINVTPVKLKLGKNITNKIRAIAENYGIYEESIVLSEDKTKIINFNKTNSNIIIKTNIPAKVYYEYTLLGETPLKLNLMNKNHQLTFVSQFPKQTIDINVNKNDEEINVELKNEAKLDITTNKESQVTIDGIPYGYSYSTSFYSKEISGGKHFLKIKANNYQEINKEININQDMKLHFDFPEYYNHLGAMFGLNLISGGAGSVNGNVKGVMGLFSIKLGMAYSFLWEDEYKNLSSFIDKPAYKRVSFEAELFYPYPYMGGGVSVLYYLSAQKVGISFGPKFILFQETNMDKVSDTSNDNYDINTASSKNHISFGAVISLYTITNKDNYMNWVEFYAGYQMILISFKFESLIF